MNQLLDHLDKLHSFVIIADTGSLQGAAKHLHISQPALSLKLRTLEDAVEAKLFTRSKKGVELTLAGHNLYRFSKRVISDADTLSLELIGEHSRIHIGTFDIVTQMISRNLCRTDSISDITFRTERSGLVLLDALEKEEIDIAVVDDPPNIPGLIYQKIARSPYSLFAAKGLAKKFPQSGDELLLALQDAPLIYLPGSLAYENTGTGKQAPKMLIESFVEQLGLGRGKRICVDSYTLGLEITRQGHGIGMMLTGHILDHLQSGALVEMTHKNLRMPFSSMLYMVTKASRDRSLIAPAMKEIKATFENAITAYQTVKNNK